MPTLQDKEKESKRWNEYLRKNRMNAVGTRVDEHTVRNQYNKEKKASAEKFSKNYAQEMQDMLKAQKEKALNVSTIPTISTKLDKLREGEEYKSMLAQKKQVAEEGISPEEREAFRSKMSQQMSQAEATTGLRMGAALGGAQGAGVAAQQRSLAQAGMQGRAGIERDIFLAQEKAKRGGLEAYGETLEQGIKFDIGTSAQEKAMQIQQQALQQAEVSARKQAEIAAQAARGGGGKK